MSIRLRLTEVGWVAICAARSVPKEGDVYLDDGHHHALSVKFADDFASMGFMPARDAGADHPDTLMRAATEREESNNPNREWWDRTYAPTAPTPEERSLENSDIPVSSGRTSDG